MIDYVIANSADLIALLFGLLGVFSVVAKLTPTEVDNKLLAIVTKLIHAFGLTKK